MEKACEDSQSNSYASEKDESSWASRSQNSVQIDKENGPKESEIETKEIEIP